MINNIKNKFIALCLMQCSQSAFATGDSIATTEGGLYFAIGIGVFILLCLAIVVYVCVKIAGPKQRGKWLLLGGLPSIACATLFSWKLAVLIAFGVAFWLQHKAELASRAAPDNDNENKR